jgi:hypothetical protein
MHAEALRGEENPGRRHGRGSVAQLKHVLLTPGAPALANPVSRRRFAEEAERKVHQLEGALADASHQLAEARQRQVEEQRRADDLGRCVCVCVCVVCVCVCA